MPVDNLILNDQAPNNGNSKSKKLNDIVVSTSATTAFNSISTDYFLVTAPTSSSLAYYEVPNANMQISPSILATGVNPSWSSYLGDLTSNANIGVSGTLLCNIGTSDALANNSSKASYLWNGISYAVTQSDGDVYDYCSVIYTGASGSPNTFNSMLLIYRKRVSETPGTGTISTDSTPIHILDTNYKLITAPTSSSLKYYNVPNTSSAQTIAANIISGTVSGDVIASGIYPLWQSTSHNGVQVKENSEIFQNVGSQATSGTDKDTADAISGDDRTAYLWNMPNQITITGEQDYWVYKKAVYDTNIPERMFLLYQQKYPNGGRFR